MPRNAEIKLRVAGPDLDRVRRIAAGLAPAPPSVLRQVDVFYPARAGRLKLRILSDAEGELISYARADAPDPKVSSYSIAPTRDPIGLREVLSAALGEIVVVRKTREVFLAGRTRIHLDRVDSLGSFVELEVMLGEAEPAETGIREAEDLLGKLGIDTAERIAGAYADLLLGRVADPAGAAISPSPVTEPRPAPPNAIPPEGRQPGGGAG